MTEENKRTTEQEDESLKSKEKSLQTKTKSPKKEDKSFVLTSSPHLSSSVTTQKMMIDVLISLIPLVVASVYFFKIYAVKQILICLVSCLLAEYVFTKARGKDSTLFDFSASITAIILALSLPATAPAFIGVIASVIAIGVGKVVFGGLGMNIFNPAMVGRAFVMISFANFLGAGGYELANGSIDIMSCATPMNAFKQAGEIVPLSSMFWGATNGSIGETSAFACILGGLYLCIKKVAAWEIPLSMILTVIFWAALASLTNGSCVVMHHLFGGALLFGAFFIATDPVTSPITKKGKIIFGVGAGSLVMLIRIFSGYPEGLMFAILLMNSVTPLINNWTIPKAFGAK